MEEVRYQNPKPDGLDLQRNHREDIYNEHNFLVIGESKDAKKLIEVKISRKNLLMGILPKC